MLLFKISEKNFNSYVMEYYPTWAKYFTEIDGSYYMLTTKSVGNFSVMARYSDYVLCNETKGFLANNTKEKYQDVLDDTIMMCMMYNNVLERIR